MEPDEEPGRWREALQRARIPERFWVASPGEVKGDNRWMATALTRPQDWAGKGCGFYLHGPFNTGKSAAAAILAMDFVRRCHVVLWLSVREVPAVRFREGELGKLNDRLHDVDLLVLDDLGSERFRLESAAGSALEEVVRIMYDRNRPVVFTANKAWDEFQNVYGSVPAFVSVVQRMVIPVALLDPWPGAPGIGLK